MTSRRSGVPAVYGRPATSMFAFTATGTPASGAAGSTSSTRASARSRATAENALSGSASRAMRSR